MNTESKNNAQSVSPVTETTQSAFIAATDATSAQDLTPPQLEVIKGGPGGGGGIWLNHNETAASDSDANESAPVAGGVDTTDVIPAQDLTPPQPEVIKGGPGGGGGIWLNHNETAAGDSDANESLRQSQ